MRHAPPLTATIVGPDRRARADAAALVVPRRETPRPPLRLEAWLPALPRLRPHAHPDAADLLRTEHAVVRVLASAAGETEAYPGLLAAIGESLELRGSAWLPREDGELRCAETWPAGAARRRVAGGRGVGAAPVAVDGAFAFPLPGVGVMAFATAAPLEPDADLLATMESLGTQISQFVERCRAQQAVRASEARKTAILNAAFDCIITMDHDGNVVEVNRATERTFGYRAEEMIGRELAELIVPPALREAHRRGVARYLRTRPQHGRRAPARASIGMRADGSEFPVELVVTRADLPGPPLFCGYLRDMTEARAREREQRRLADEQAALRRVATAVAASTDPRRVFGVVTEEVARLLRRPELEHGALQRRRRRRPSWAGGASRAITQHPGRRHGARWTATRRRRASTARGAPARVETTRTLDGELAATPARARLPLRGRRADLPRRAPVGRGDRLQRRPGAAPAGRRAADRGLRRARRAGAGQRASRASELAASRARIVAAGDAERRRLERNLHDGAQQRLVSLALMLRLAARRHPRRRRPGAGRRGAHVRAGGAARARPRHPPGRADRARARAGGRVAGRAGAAAGRARHRARRSGCRARSRPPRTTSSPRR